MNSEPKQTVEAGGGLSEVTECAMENTFEAFYTFCTQKNASAAKLD